MKLKEVWNEISALSKTVTIISSLCLIMAIVNLFIHSQTITILVNWGLIMVLILDFLIVAIEEAKARKRFEISEYQKQELLFMHMRVETRLIDTEKESWTPLEIQSIFLDERERYLKEIEDE